MKIFSPIARDQYRSKQVHSYKNGPLKTELCSHKIGIKCCLLLVVGY